MNYEHLKKIFHKYPDKYEEIYNNRFNSEASYKLPIIINGYSAFFVVSNELLTDITQSYKISNNLTEIINDELLRTASNKMYSTDFAKNSFVNKILIDEVIETNDIEGIKSTRKDILNAIEANFNDLKDVRYQGLVNKYLAIIDEKKIDFMSNTKIRTLYNDIVLNELDQEDIPDGLIFRKDTVTISDGSTSVHNGIHPESKIIEAMDNAFAILNDDNIQMVIRIALFHYLIGYIHPFYDGNGRLSRFISSYLLKQEFNNTFVALKLSYEIKKNKKKYYEAFEICNDIRNRGDLTYFIITFIEFITNAIKDTTDEYVKSFHNLEYYIKKIISSNIDKKTMKILICLSQAHIFSNNQLLFKELGEVTGVNQTTLRVELERLNKQGLVDKRKKGKKFLYSLNITKFDQLF